MKCKRFGCPELVKGKYAHASVYDEARAAKDKLYVGPHTEIWCLKCYKEFEAHKYTYVMKMPKTGTTKREATRVPRAVQPNDLRTIEQVRTASDEVPVESVLPEWAKTKGPDKKAKTSAVSAE